MEISYPELLQLTKHEQKILLFLPTENGVNVSDTARITGIPRMSVYLALDSLKKRGLVDYDRKGKRRFWHRLSNQQFSELMRATAKDIYDDKERVEVTHSKESGFIILRGLPHLFSIFERIAAGHKSERLVGIQPTSSMRNVVKKFSWEALKPIQNAIKKNKIIVEGLIREDYYPTLISLLKTTEDKKDALKSFIGRSTDMVLVSNEYLNSETELMMFKDVAFLVNWKDEVALEIKNKEMLAFLSECFYLARGYGKKIDQNEYLKRLETAINQTPTK